MKTLIISAITCLLMASCQNEVGRYQFDNTDFSNTILDTKEGIVYQINNGSYANLVTGERGAFERIDSTTTYYWKVTVKGTTVKKAAKD
mgnify:CR=1 FL=1|tara:strand:- start:991 stop:1257 length:267 start_codon:yes stop_codon:yes gene_type:complete